MDGSYVRLSRGIPIEIMPDTKKPKPTPKKGATHT